MRDAARDTLSMTKNDNSGRRPRRQAANPPIFLVGSRPSFMEILGSRPSSLERSANEKETELKTVPPSMTPHRLADAWKEKLAPAVQEAKVMLGIGRNAKRNGDPLSKSTIRL